MGNLLENLDNLFNKKKVGIRKISEYEIDKDTLCRILKYSPEKVISMEYNQSTQKLIIKVVE